MPKVEVQPVLCPRVLPDWQMERMAKRGADVVIAQLGTDKSTAQQYVAYLLAYKVLEAAGFVAECNSARVERTGWHARVDRAAKVMYEQTANGGDGSFDDGRMDACRADCAALLRAAFPELAP